MDLIWGRRVELNEEPVKRNVAGLKVGSAIEEPGCSQGTVCHGKE